LIKSIYLSPVKGKPDVSRNLENTFRPGVYPQQRSPLVQNNRDYFSPNPKDMRHSRSVIDFDRKVDYGDLNGLKIKKDTNDMYNNLIIKPERVGFESRHSPHQ
jgi:hypothetical protein